LNKTILALEQAENDFGVGDGEGKEPSYILNLGDHADF
jgi:hypothetical protein